MPDCLGKIFHGNCIEVFCRPAIYHKTHIYAFYRICMLVCQRQKLDFIELPIVQGKERIKGADGRATHPIQKPEKLLELIIKASSNENDIVLDPFFGSGTTGAIAKKLDRNFIGFEICKEYFDIAKKRIGRQGICRSQKTFAG